MIPSDDDLNMEIKFEEISKTVNNYDRMIVDEWEKYKEKIVCDNEIKRQYETVNIIRLNNKKERLFQEINESIL